MFVIEDEMHAEQIGEFATKDEALNELRRLAALPWDEAPMWHRALAGKHAAAAMSCLNTIVRRGHGALERTPTLEVSQAGTNWLV